MSRLRFDKFVAGFLLACLLGSSPGMGVQASRISSHDKFTPVQQQPGDRQASIPPGFQVISSSATRLILDIQAPAFMFETKVSEGNSCRKLEAEGYTQSGTPGEPGLVTAGVLLAIPIGRTPTFTLQNVETIDLPGQIHLCPVATPEIQYDPPGIAINNGDALIENKQAYIQDHFLPTQPVELVNEGMIRSQHVARLGFTPFLYNAFTGELKYIKHVTVEVRYEANHFLQTKNAYVDEGPFEAILQSTLINYQQGREWRYPHQPNMIARAEDDRLQATGQAQYKIVVDRDGIYQVTYSALQAAGVPLDQVDPKTIRLFNHGVEVPIYISGDGDGIFDPVDYFIFYGQKTNTKYTNDNVYWLSWGGEFGIRMSTLDGTIHSAATPYLYRASKHLEEDHLYINNRASGFNLDHWYWILMNGYSEPVSQDFTFAIQNLAPISSTINIRGLLKGYFADPQHHTRIYLNGYLIDDQFWPSTDDYLFSADIPQDYLVEGSNTIKVECPLDSGIIHDLVLVNWFEVDYDRSFRAETNQLDFAWDQPGLWQFQIGGFISNTIDIFDITEPFTPTRVLSGTIIPDEDLYQVDFEQKNEGESYYLVISPSEWLTPVSISLDASSSLKNISNGADYIIVSPADFMNAIQPLAIYHANKGFRVKIVDVQDVYDEFSGGVIDPQAIQEFLAYTYLSWSRPAPVYVLLVGDGNYDFKNYYGDSGPNYIPPYLGEFDPWIGETASDNRFVTISGDDILPDMTVGRLPANNADEVTSMVNKILSYEQMIAQGEWISDLTFVADNPDGAGDFPRLSDKIADNYFTDTYTRDKIYFGTEPYTNTLTTQAAILDAINQGRIMVNYIGHGSVQFWAAENLFSVNSLTNLTNDGMYPFFTPMTCAEGYFIFPTAQGFNYPSLAESLLRANNAGAIGSFSPSGFGLSSGHDLLAKGLYQAFFGDGTLQFGPATTFAKYYLVEQSESFRDLIDTYNLFGDPAASLKIPMQLISLPLVIK